MSRAAFNETVASVAADGTLKAISNVQVTVRKVSDNSLATLWNDRTASNPGNSVSNPMVTGANGLVSFYADAGEYNISYHDQTAPARIADQTFGWDAVPGSQNPEALGFSLGDLKLSSVALDHGRWLRMDGRELSQAEIEAALSLPAGDAAAFVAYMGTGSSSKYGTAASSKVKLADARRKALFGAGTTADNSPAPMAGTTAKPLGTTGGAETVTLTAGQSGVRTHTHAVGTLAVGAHSHGAGALTVNSHTHDDGTLASAAHTHPFGTLSVLNHHHDYGTLRVASHAHTGGTLVSADHLHSGGGLVAGDHTHAISFNTTNESASYGISYQVGGSFAAIPGTNALNPNHVHGVGGATGGSGSIGVTGYSGGADRTLAVTGATDPTSPFVSSGNTGDATAGITGSTGAATATDVAGNTGAAAPGVSGTTATATATVTGATGNPASDTAGGADALDAHPNMPPHVAIGYVFIRV